MTAAREPFVIGDATVSPGRRKKLELPIASLVSGTPVALPMVVLHGVHDGPMFWMTAALHGDELCGVEIVRRVLGQLDPKALRGTVVAIPVANVHGFNTGDRYLPDRRDLNRSFPGSRRGSLASRIANLMMKEVITRGDVGVDLHTGSDHRVNLPQVRADLDDPETLELAKLFGAPVALHSRTRDGSLRQAATEAGSTVLLYEGGEADRFDEHAIAVGTTGVLRLIRHLGVADVDVPGPKKRSAKVRIARGSKWVRASRSGIAHLEVGLGDLVEKGATVATIHDPFGKRLGAVSARSAGVIVGHTQRPLVIAAMRSPTSPRSKRKRPRR